MHLQPGEVVIKKTFSISLHKWVVGTNIGWLVLTNQRLFFHQSAAVSILTFLVLVLATNIFGLIAYFLVKRKPFDLKLPEIAKVEPRFSGRNHHPSLEITTIDGRQFSATVGYDYEEWIKAIDVE